MVVIKNKENNKYSTKEKQLIKKITEIKCKDWVSKPLENPITNAKIEFKGPTYNILQTVCKDTFNINVSAKDKKLALPRLLKEVDGILMPQSSNQWIKNELINKDFEKIIILIENPKRKLLSEYVYKLFPSYIKLCKLGIKYKIIPDDKIVEVKKFIEKFTFYKKKANLPKDVFIIKMKYIDEMDKVPRNNINNNEIKITTMINSGGTSKEEIAQKIAANDYYKLLYDYDMRSRIVNWGSNYNYLTNSSSYKDMMAAFNALK